MAEGEVGWRGHFPEMIRLAMFWRCSSISGLPAATPRNLAEPAKTRRACQPKLRQYVPATRPYLHYGSADAPCQHSILRMPLTVALIGNTARSAEGPSATPVSIYLFPLAKPPTVSTIGCVDMNGQSQRLLRKRVERRSVTISELH